MAEADGPGDLPGATPGAIASQSAPARLREQAIENEEHAAGVVRMRAALGLGLCIWPIWFLVDWMVVALIEPGILWHYAVLRAVGVAPAWRPWPACTRPPCRRPAWWPCSTSWPTAPWPSS